MARGRVVLDHQRTIARVEIVRHDLDCHDVTTAIARSRVVQIHVIETVSYSSEQIIQ